MAYDVTTAFGANNLVNDNTTDNTAKLNAIFGGTSTPALTAPYTLYFPGGSGYVFASTPTAIPSNVTLCGDGKNQTIIKGTRAAPSGGAVLSVGANSNITLRDLYITTPDTANACDQCVGSSGATNLVMTRVKMSNGNSACLRAASPTQVFMSGCELTNVHTNASGSLISGSLVNSVINSCWFHDNGGLLNTNHCIYLSGASVPQNVVISNNVFQNYTGSALDLTGNPGVTPALNIDVIGNTFIPASANATSIMDVQTVFGINIVGNTFNMTYGGTMALYSTQNFVISNNVFNMLATGANRGVAGISLVDDGTLNRGGLISNNVFSAPSGLMQFGSGIQMYAAQNVSVVDNVFTGLFLGVGLNGAATGVSYIEIRDNSFNNPIGGTNTTGPGYFYGNNNTYYGIGVDGACPHLRALDNYCQGLTYELFFTRFNFTGQTDSVKFRSASWAGSNTNTFGFQGSAAPTNVVQLGSASMPVTSTGGANPHAYTTPTT